MTVMMRELVPHGDSPFGRSRADERRSRGRVHTLAVLDRVIGSPPGPARLRPEDFSALGTGGLPAGEVTVTIEIVFDPPGHVRLRISDDEMISRIVAIEPLAGRPVTLVTYDTGQATRGRAAGMQVRKLDKPERRQQPLVADERKSGRTTAGNAAANG
jgi:hypothetical protein